MKGKWFCVESIETCQSDFSEDDEIEAWPFREIVGRLMGLIEDNDGGALESVVTAADVHANITVLKKASSIYHRRFVINTSGHHASYQAVLNDHGFKCEGKVLTCS